jgi:hypothetical protein
MHPLHQRHHPRGAAPRCALSRGGGLHPMAKYRAVCRRNDCGGGWAQPPFPPMPGVHGGAQHRHAQRRASRHPQSRPRCCRRAVRHVSGRRRLPAPPWASNISCAPTGVGSTAISMAMPTPWSAMGAWCCAAHRTTTRRRWRNATSTWSPPSFPTHLARQVRGMDEGVDAWEDWAFHIRLAQAGICGYRTDQPIFVYRVYEGDRMTRFYGGDSAHMTRVLERYHNEQGGDHRWRVVVEETLRLAAVAAQAVQDTPAPTPVDVGGRVRIKYLGNEDSLPFDLGNNRLIRLGKHASRRYADVTAGRGRVAEGADRHCGRAADRSGSASAWPPPDCAGQRRAHTGCAVKVVRPKRAP